MTMKSLARLTMLFFAVTALAIASLAQEPDQLTDTSNLHIKSQNVPPRDHTNGQAHARFGINGIDSLLNFNDHFFEDGFNSDGLAQNHWFTNIVGNPANMHGTTTFSAPIVPVVVRLLDAAGNLRFAGGQPLIVDPTPFLSPLLQSLYSPTPHSTPAMSPRRSRMRYSGRSFLPRQKLTGTHCSRHR
jgi:hypothetical protein